MKRIKSTKHFTLNLNKFNVSNTNSLNKAKNINYKSSTNILLFKNNNNEPSKSKDFSSAYNNENKFDFFSPIINRKKHSTRKELMIFTEELFNKINNGDNIIGEGHIGENSKDLKFSKNTSLNDSNYNIDEDLNIKDNRKNADLGPKLFLTSTALNHKIRNKKQMINLKRNNNKYYSPKNTYKKYKLLNKNFESMKPIELLLRKKEYEFEHNFKTPKSIRLLLNNFYKNRNMKLKKISEKNKINYKFIKSDLEQKTLTIEKREKINLFKLKEYSKFQKYFLGAISHSDKINNEINRFRDKHYSSFKNLEIYKKYKKSLLEENDINLMGCVDLRDYKKNKL